MENIINSYSTSFNLSSAVLLTSLIIIGVYVIYSVILFYHWKSFSSDPKVTTVTITAYLITTIPLLIIMSILAFII